MITSDLEEQIKLDLTRHEGCICEVYLDHLGLPTAGIGHLIEEPGYEVGDEVSMEQVLEWFDIDYKEAVTDCCALFLNFGSLPDHVKRVLVNMAFNLGRTRLGHFKNMTKAINEGNWNKAADEMVDSKWYRQVGNRSIELVEIMRNGEA